MIGSVLKVLPMALIFAGGAKVLRKGDRFLGGPQRVATQVEVSEMLKLLRLDAIDGSIPDPAGFGDYLRRNMRVTGGVARDVTLDAWGTPYVLERSGNRAFVRSAGPDKTLQTTDDVTAGTEL